MLQSAIDEYAYTLNKVFNTDRTKTVGASEIGQCARKTFATKFEGTRKGLKRDEDWIDAYGARVRGTIMEDAFWQPALKAKFGDKMLFSGKEQRTLKLGYLSATPDALIIDQPRDALKHLGIPDIGADCFKAECKTIDPRTNLTEAKVENLFQVHVQIGLTRELTPYKPVYNVLTYMDASFWSEVIEYPVEFDESIYNAAKDRATIIMTAESAADLPPEGWIAGGKECSFCPFVGACGAERRQVPKDNAKATPQFVAEISDYCRQANEIELKIKAAEVALRETQIIIKDRMRTKGVRRIQGVVNWYPVGAPTHYSSKKMRARLTELGEDIEEFASEGVETDRLVIAAIPAVLPVTNVMPGKLKKRKARKVKPKKQTAKSKPKKQTAKSKKQTAKRKK